MLPKVSSTDNISVSVIIPVYNDVEGLKLCLQALQNQTYPQHLREIIVVDNDSENSQAIENSSLQEIISDSMNHLKKLTELISTYSKENN